MGANDPLNTHAPIVSIEAEQSVLGGLLLDNEAFEIVSEILRAEDFTTGEHRAIFEAIRDLLNASGVADVVTVYERLQSTRAKVDEPLRYLNELVQNTPSAANIRHYATIVRNRTLLRGIAKTARRMHENVHNPNGRDPLELLEEAQAGLMRLADTGAEADQEFQPISLALTRVVEGIDERYTRGGGSAIGGVPTGFVDLDRKTDGMHGGELIIIGGRPSMGKTSFAMNISENVAVGQGLPVAVVTLEMPSEQLAQRMLASASRLNQHKLRTANLRDDEWPQLTAGVQKLVDVPVHVLDGSMLTPLQLQTKLRRLQRQLGTKLGLVVIDYLQLMASDGKAGDNRAVELSSISRSLKIMAKALDVPVIALSQLNRGVEQRPNKRPVMSDIRESGSIEQDADVILFIYRDEVYNPDSQDKGSAEIIIAKQRNGELGPVRLAFHSGLTRFEDFAFQAA